LYLIYVDPTSFRYADFDLKKDGMDAVTAYYFSVTTIATVGFGDIFPVSSRAKLAVMSEIFLGLLYSLFILANLASFIKGSKAQSS
jgi:hypothetical protein